MKLTNITIELCGVLLCIMGVLTVLVGARIEKRAGKYFVAVFLCLLVDLLSNISGQIFRGASGTFGYYAVRLSNFCEFFFGYLLTFLVTRYLLYCVDRKREKKVLRRGVDLYFVLQILLLCISQFNHMYYGFDASNVYHRGELFWLSQAVSLGLMVLDVWILFHYRTCLSGKERLAFGVYIGLPSIMLVFQMYFYGLYLVLFASVAGAFALFLFIIDTQTEKYCRQERENADMRAAVMLSQIQPHFLYNTLDSIYYLCGKDPDRAKEAISQFTDYLRINLSSLSRRTPVPFETEIRHVETYLMLEKMSSEDTLDYIMDITCSGFLLPALTIQPLVENAVKHGISKKAGGGTVTVCSREYEDHFEVTVTDDGVGFDPDQPQEDGKIHIGIDNVRRRLEAMCEGTLTLKSRKGEGTTAVVVIPKGERSHEDTCSR